MSGNEMIPYDGGRSARSSWFTLPSTSRFPLLSSMFSTIGSYFCINDPPDAVDCSVREVALEVLSLREEEADDPNKLREKYEAIVEKLNSSKLKVSASPQLVSKFEMLQKRVDEAYKTLSNGESPPVISEDA